MHRLPITRAGRRALRGAARRAAAAQACAAAAAGCSSDRLLQVETPTIARPETLTGASGLNAYYAAAIGDFIVGFSGDPFGGFEGLLNYGGLLADEIGSVDTFPTRNDTDSRNTQFDNTSNADVFRAIQRSRATAELAARQFETSSVTGAAADPRRAEVQSLAGFAYVLMAENYCSGVPISSLDADGVTLRYGQPQTTAQLFQSALAKFDSALTIATAAGPAGADVANLARVGRGRALLGLGTARYADAAAAVAAVPDAFVYNVFTSANTPRQNNGAFFFFNINQRLSAVDREGGNGLPYLSANDPRVPYQDTNAPGFDGARELIVQLKYPQRTSPIPLASGVEARLIQAEAANAANDGAGFVRFVNLARAASGATGTVTDPGAGRARVDLLFRERGFALWLTGHRLGDMRRLVRDYGRPANTVYPVGEYSGGGEYGTDVNLPIPVQEGDNPNYAGACNKQAA